MDVIHFKLADLIIRYRLCMRLNVYNNYMTSSEDALCKRIMFLLIMTIPMWGILSSSADAHRNWLSRFIWGRIIT